MAMATRRLMAPPPPPTRYHHLHLLLLLLLIIMNITSSSSITFFVASSSTIGSSSSSSSSSTSTTSTLQQIKSQQQQQKNLSSKSIITSLCYNSTPYPQVCIDSLKLISISIGINISNLTSILTFALQSLNSAISQANKLSSLLGVTATAGIVEKQRSALHDCQELHQITLSSLHKSASSLAHPTNYKLAADVRVHLSAALTNKDTCLEGLQGASGPLKPLLLASILDMYRHVSNSLSLLSPPSTSAKHKPAGRRLHEFPSWLKRRDRRLLQSDDYGDDPAAESGSILTVAADGTGNFSSIGDAIAFAPNNSADRTIILVREGVYEENVDIPSYKTNIVLLGEGSDVTLITAKRSAADGWTTFRSATVAVSGEGFLARDIGIENTAGASKGQAAALRVNADQTAIFRCSIDGYQDTLYVHSFRQFYRECDVYGTVDFVFGNAAVVFQGCNLVAKVPRPGQSNVVTAQSRDDPNEVTGISIQNCSVIPSDELMVTGQARTYLGRPWRVYSTVVYMESYIDSHVDPAGWSEWSSSVGDKNGLKTLYYGEYMNSGPGSTTDGRVTWPGFHVMGYDDAFNFTVSQFIYGDLWLDSTSFPYDDGV